MSQVLVVHADPAVRDAVRGSVEKSGHKTYEAKDGMAALGWAKSSALDLVIADLRLRTPDVQETRTAIRRVAALPRLPFLFLDGAGQRDAAVVSRLAENEDLVVVRGPFADGRVPRLVEALLGESKRVEGGFSGDAFDRLLLRIEGGRETGVLSAFRGTVVKKIVFHDGAVAFAGSNDPRELIGQWFVSAGLVTEAKLKEAMAAQAASHEPLAKVLQKVSRLSREQAEDTVRRKFEECVLDLFLWRDGGWSYSASAPGAPPENSLEIPLGELRVEGIRRRAAWKELASVIPSEELRVELIASPRAAAAEPERKMLSLLEKGASIARLKLELRSPDFEIYSRVQEMVRDGAARVVDNALPEPTPEELAKANEEEARASAKKTAERERLAALEGETDPIAAARALLEQAEAALAHDDMSAARRIYREVLVLDPANAFARRGLGEIDAQVAQRIRDAGLSSDRAVVRRLSDEEIAERGLAPDAYFILSRIDPWGTKIEDLLVVTPLPEVQVLEILEDLVSSGLVTLS